MSENNEWKVDQEEIDRLIDDENKIQSVELEDLTDGESEGFALGDLAALNDVTLPVRVVFGKVKKRVEEVLRTRKGDIITLDRFAGEAVDVIVGERIMAKGEITVVDGERFGVKIVEILPSGERIE